MSDTFQGAEESADAQKRALLAAIAQQGSAAKDQFSAQAQAWGDRRNQAVAGAAERAGAIGAPADAVAQLQQSATSAAEPYAQDAWRAAQAQDAENTRMTTANSNYMDQLRSAIPIARSVASARIAEIQAEAADRAAQRASNRSGMSFAAEDQAFQREKMQWDREDRARKNPVMLPTRSIDEAAAALNWKNPEVARSAIQWKNDAGVGFADVLSGIQGELAAGATPEEVLAMVYASWPEGGSVPALALAMAGIDDPRNAANFGAPRTRDQWRPNFSL